MNTKVLKTLEYDKIILRLTEKTATPLGTEKAKALVPMEDLDDIEQAQQETSDALSRVFAFGPVSCSGARDIRDSLLRLKIQASLSISELLSVSVLLKAAARVRSYGFKQDPEKPDSLTPYFEALVPCVGLQQEIERCILSEEEIADDASSKLKSVRRRISAAEAKVRSELNALVASNNGYLRENVVTMRNGRYCVPVKQEYRQQVPGMIHDESGSGSTVFIEPLSVVKLNNEIRELQIEEQKEIEAILAALSEQAAQNLDALTNDLELLSDLDFIFAKASLARDMNAVRPAMNTEKRIRLRQARHPLLNKDTVVPIDLTLGDEFYQLIVTGPNTGGKTVSLKTLGLLQLMGQAGLHIPAFEGSELSVFTEVYADIGDEQSIEQSLSTFSSHMVNIVEIIDKADADSLVLLDELCSGTDPSEGAALAIAILTYLGRMQIRTMATTHYSELKLYALSTEGVENASCEFDVRTLSPTYRLLVGIPGKSNAFAISKKLGLPGFIIDEARENLDTDTERFEDVIKELDNNRRNIEKEKLKIRALKEEARQLRDSLEKQESRIDAEKERILAEANAEARKLLSEAKEQVDKTIRELNKSGQGGSTLRELEKLRTETREQLDKTKPVTKDEPKKKANTKAKDLHIGDTVLVLSMNMKGTVSSLPDAKGNLFVQMGILRTQVHVSDVQLIEEETVSVGGKPVGGPHGGSFSKAMTVSPEINLIGKTVDEAMPDLEKFLDDAYLAHLEKVRIVHGRGTGALRKAVQNRLKKLSYIKEFHSGEYGEGDTGVTIATFK